MVRLTDRPDMTLDVYCGHKTTIQQQQLRYVAWQLWAVLEESHVSEESTTRIWWTFMAHAKMINSLNMK